MHALGADPEEIVMTLVPPRSWLFVPADSEKKIAKALDSDADALIFDLEDSVAPARKDQARQILKDLPARSEGPQWWVRINPLDSEYMKADLGLFASADFEGVVLPKAESGADVAQLAQRVRERIAPHARDGRRPAAGRLDLTHERFQSIGAAGRDHDWAALTQRLIAEHGLSDWKVAKRKACRELGLPDHESLPGNEEVEQALRERNAALEIGVNDLLARVRQESA